MDEKQSNQEELKLSIKTQFKTKNSRTKFTTRCGMFTALSFVLYILKFPLPSIFPAFLEVNFSNLAIVIGSLSLGPVGGLIICVGRFLLKIMFNPTHTMFIGELTDLLLSALIMLPASLYYMFNHNKKGGYIGIILSYVSWIIFSLLINWLISLPLYISLYDLDSVLGMINEVLKSANETNYVVIYLFGAVLPFNASVGLVSSLVTLFLYKKISILMKKMGI